MEFFNFKQYLYAIEFSWLLENCINRPTFLIEVGADTYFLKFYYKSDKNYLLPISDVWTANSRSYSI